MLLGWIFPIIRVVEMAEGHILRFFSPYVVHTVNRLYEKALLGPLK